MSYLKYFDDGGSATVEGYEPMEGSQVNGGGTVDRLQKFYRGYFPPGTKERILEMISPKKALERRRERKAEKERQRQMEELEEDNRLIDYMEPEDYQVPLPEGVYEAAKGGNLKNGNDMAGKYGKGGYIEYFQNGGTTRIGRILGQLGKQQNSDRQLAYALDRVGKSGQSGENDNDTGGNRKGSRPIRIRKSMAQNGGSGEYACGGKASRKQYGGGLNAVVEHSDEELKKIVKQADMLVKKAVSNGEYDGDRWQYMSPKFVWREKLYRLIKDYPELYERYDMDFGTSKDMSPQDYDAMMAASGVDTTGRAAMRSKYYGTPYLDSLAKAPLMEPLDYLE